MASRIALVTGANQGIGYATVRRLCKEHPSWVVYGTSRSEKNGEEAAAKLKEEGCSATFLKADLTNEASFVAVRDILVAKHGGLDVLINNAGMAYKVAATESQAEKVNVTLSTNVFGTYSVCQTLFPILRDGARIVILSSMLAPMALHKIKKLKPELYAEFIKNDPPMIVSQVLVHMQSYIDSVKAGDFHVKGWPDDSAYSMSKMADTLLARAMQVEFDAQQERDIVVNAADPGYVSTNMSSYKGKLTIDEGADTPYYLAALPPKTDIRGKHVAKRAIVEWV